MRLHRLIGIVLLLEARGQLKASELAAALETSVRSIYRDVDVLAESGIPIVSTPGPGGGISMMQGYTSNLKQLNGDEVVHLYLTGMGIYSGGDAEPRIKLKNALLKLEQTLPDSYREDIETARTRFYFDDSPWWTELAPVPCLETIRSAVWQTLQLRIQYTKVNGETTSRTLQPYGLVVKQGEWYLVACSLETGEVRTFKCERIKVASIMEESFEYPAGFILEQHWRQAENTFKEQRRQEELYPVMILIEQSDRELTRSLEILESIEEEGQVRLQVNMYSRERAMRIIRTLLGISEIIGPPELRAYAREQLIQQQRRYD